MSFVESYRTANPCRYSGATAANVSPLLSVYLGNDTGFDLYFGGAGSELLEPGSADLGPDEREGSANLGSDDREMDPIDLLKSAGDDMSDDETPVDILAAMYGKGGSWHIADADVDPLMQGPDARTIDRRGPNDNEAEGLAVVVTLMVSCALAGLASTPLGLIGRSGSDGDLAGEAFV